MLTAPRQSCLVAHQVFSCRLPQRVVFSSGRRQLRKVHLHARTPDVSTPLPLKGRSPVNSRGRIYMEQLNSRSTEDIPPPEPSEETISDQEWEIRTGTEPSPQLHKRGLILYAGPMIRNRKSHIYSAGNAS